MEKVRIETSRDLQVITVMRGNRGPKQPKQALICSQKDFEEFFDGAPPEIDLPNGFVGVIALGEKRTGGYYAAVKNAYQFTFGISSGLVQINYSEMHTSGPHTNELTYPFIIFTMPDLQYATSVVFNELKAQSNEIQSFAAIKENGGKFIVIAITATGDECKIVPEGSFYPMIYSQVFGPASHEECEKYINESC